MKDGQAEETAPHIQSASFDVGVPLTVLNCAFRGLGRQTRVREIEVASQFCDGFCVVAGTLVSVPPRGRTPAWGNATRRQRMELRGDDGLHADTHLGAMLLNGGYQDAAVLVDVTGRGEPAPTTGLSAGLRYRPHGFWVSEPGHKAVRSYQVRIPGFGNNAVLVLDFDPHAVEV